MKVLIADDSAFMRGVLKDILTHTKWADSEVVEAGDGQDAVEKIKTENPDLVLLDIIMPIKDGLEVLKEVSDTSKSVVIVSAVGQEKVITEAKGLGAKEFIVKPFDTQKVVEVLNNLAPVT